MAKAKKEIVLNKDYDESFDEILLDGVETAKKNEIQQIPIIKLMPFKDHPFKVLDDDKMEELIESITDSGILSPVVVRPKGDMYELISGHRRTHAARRVGLTEIPAVVRNLNDDEATVLMVDANIQREEILPSERAHSLKMKMDALSRIRSTGNNLGRHAREIIGESAGISGRQVQRYLSLNSLNQGFLDMVDSKRIQMALGLDIASMRKDVQQWIYEYVALGAVITPALITKLKEVDESEGLDKEVIGIILNETVAKPKVRKITISERKLNRYFPLEYTVSEMEGVIYSLLDKWKRENEGIAENV